MNHHPGPLKKYVFTYWHTSHIPAPPSFSFLSNIFVCFFFLFFVLFFVFCFFLFVCLFLFFVFCFFVFFCFFVGFCFLVFFCFLFYYVLIYFCLMFCFCRWEELKQRQYLCNPINGNECTYSSYFIKPWNMSLNFNKS